MQVLATVTDAGRLECCSLCLVLKKHASDLSGLSNKLLLQNQDPAVQLSMLCRLESGGTARDAELSIVGILVVCAAVTLD